MRDLKQKQAENAFVQIWIIVKRIFKTQVTRRPFNTVIQMILGIVVGFFISFLSKDPIGPKPLCVDPHPNPESSMRSLKDVTEAFTLYFMLLMYTTFSFAMTACMTFSHELSIISKEVANSWYSIYSFYFAKVLSDALLLMITFTPMFLTVYLCTQQPPSFERGIKFFLICCASGFLWQGWAQVITIVCGKRPEVSVLIIVTIVIPMYLLSGLFIKVNDMAAAPKALSFISDMRFSIEGLILAIYSERCEGLPALRRLGDTLPTKSAIFNLFSIDSSQQGRDFIIVASHVCLAKSLLLVVMIARIFLRKKL
jgi:hypothetical protein